MLRSWIAHLLALLLMLGAATPLPARPAVEDPSPTIAERIVLLPAGCMIEVRTKTKQKLRGRLGALAADTFDLQVAQSGQLQTQPIQYAEVRSVKLVDRDRGMSTAGKV